MDKVARYFNRAFDFEERDEEAEELNAGPFKTLHSPGEIANVIEGKVGGFYKCGEKAVINTAAYQFIDDGRFSSLRLNVPPIPNGFLTAIENYFRQDLNKEAIVNVTYNRLLKRFFLRYPTEEETKREKNYIIYNFKNWLSKEESIVLQIHSHNTMPAFFSSTDDKDEYLPGLYGVMGNLDTDHPSMAFRFSGMGLEKLLTVGEIFADKEVTSYAV